MVNRKINPLVPIAVALVVLGVGGYLLHANPAWQKALFSSSGGGFTVSASRLTEITDKIRVSTRGKWLAKVRKMQADAEKVDAVRLDMFNRIENGARGGAYLEEFKKLSANHHQKIDAYDLDDPDLSIHEVYEAARATEKLITNYYRDIVGANNAINLEVPAIDAVSWVKVVPARRLELNEGELNESVVNDDLLEAFKKNIKLGSGGIEAMEKNIAKIVEKAGAAEDEETDDGWEGAEGLAFGSTQGETLMPDELALDDEGTSDGGFNTTGGRSISPGALRNQNIYLDKWYVMGPFENRFRSNLDASFLPESVVDLDNTTIGKDNKVIAWEYWTSRKQRIEPSWAPRGAVYYGWTEIYVEEAGNYWVSLGSDDYGKMWVNGELVWKSDTRPKSYRADEYTAEIEFKQGVNEILFRCENNGGTMGWSVIFHTAAMEE